MFTLQRLFPEHAALLLTILNGGVRSSIHPLDIISLIGYTQPEEGPKDSVSISMIQE